MKYCLLIISLAFVVSCSNKTSNALDELKKQEKEFYLKYKETPLTKKGAEEIIIKYTDFLKTFPKAEENPEIMLRLADVYQGTKQYFKALDVLETFSKKYSMHKKRAYVLFLKGFNCDLAYADSGFSKHKDYALFYYQEFLKKYPKHTLAKDVKASLKNINQTKPTINYER